MNQKVKEWGVFAELCVVLAGMPLAVLAPQAVWQVIGEHQAIGPLTLVAQFLAVCVVLATLMLVDGFLDALFLAITRSRAATEVCSGVVVVAVIAALFSVWVPWSAGLVLTSVISALLVLLFARLTAARYAGRGEDQGSPGENRPPAASS